MNKGTPDMKEPPNNLFRGRMKQNIGIGVHQFLSSFEEDLRLIPAAIYTYQAHCLMLYKQGYLAKEEIKKILEALDGCEPYIENILRGQIKKAELIAHLSPRLAAIQEKIMEIDVVIPLK